MNNSAVNHPGEPLANLERARLRTLEPSAQRTPTPTGAVFTRAAGPFLWTPDGRRLFDFTSGVLVANLGHQPAAWLRRIFELMGWSSNVDPTLPFVSAQPLTAYNAATGLEIEACQSLVQTLRSRPGGQRLEQILWAISGSEAIQKALWAALASRPSRPLIVATRHGFHGKKGLAHAVSGCETDPERDPRVRFISFPMRECMAGSASGRSLDLSSYERELASLWEREGSRLGCLITEPYLGAAGSFHPPQAYLRLLQQFCREHDLLFILDEVQSNFGRTECLFAFETYDLEPDLVVLGKGLGNGIPVAAVAGAKAVFAHLSEGAGSDTYSGHPLGCAAAIATIEQFLRTKIVQTCKPTSAAIERCLEKLLDLPFVTAIRGEKAGMVWGIEFRSFSGFSAKEMATRAVLAAYQRTEGSDTGVHLLGPLAGKVIRIAPPLILTPEEAQQAFEHLELAWRNLQ